MIHNAFAQPLLLYSLTALPALSLFGLWARWRRQRALASFGLAGLDGMRRVGWGLRLLGGVRHVLLLLGLMCLGVGMAGPRWGRDWGQAAAPGRDLVVV